jgi:hypothetical protein
MGGGQIGPRSAAPIPAEYPGYQDDRSNVGGWCSSAHLRSKVANRNAVKEAEFNGSGAPRDCEQIANIRTENMTKEAKPIVPKLLRYPNRLNQPE